MKIGPYMREITKHTMRDIPQGSIIVTNDANPTFCATTGRERGEKEKENGHGRQGRKERKEKKERKKLVGKKKSQEEGREKRSKQKQLKVEKIQI